MSSKVLDSPWMTLAESAAYTKRGRRWLAKEAAAGHVRHVVVGGKRERLFRREWLDEALESMAPAVVPMRRRIG